MYFNKNVIETGINKKRWPEDKRSSETFLFVQGKHIEMDRNETEGRISVWPARRGNQEGLYFFHQNRNTSKDKKTTLSESTMDNKIRQKQKGL